MSPTLFRYKNYRFFFFSREEARIHVHVACPDGEAKFWLEPTIALANSYGLKPKQLRDLNELIESKKEKITQAWKKHFQS